MNRDDVQRWLDAYVEAWQTYDPDQVATLFSAEAEYRYHPFDEEPAKGGAAIAASWVEEDRRDEPGTFDAHYEPVAVDGDIAVATGVSRYYTDATRSTLDREYGNAFLMRFDSEGRCVAFTEYYMKRAQGPG